MTAGVRLELSGPGCAGNASPTLSQPPDVLGQRVMTDNHHTLFDSVEQPEAEYRDVPDFPDYRVGDDGSVWTCKARTRCNTCGEWVRLKTTTTNMGRVVVHLYRSGRRYPKQVHALVMVAFVGPYPPGMEICHNDGDHTNNRLTNLRYDTRASNEADKDKHRARIYGDRHPVAKLDENKVREIRQLLSAGGAVRAIARRFGVDGAIVQRIRDGKAWKWVI